MTKTQLNQEWTMGLEQAIEAEAQAQAICMQTSDFERAYRAFVAKQKPMFEGTEAMLGPSAHVDTFTRDHLPPATSGRSSSSTASTIPSTSTPASS